MQTQPADPQHEKRVMSALVLSVLVLWFFSNFVFEPPPPPPETDAPISSESGNGAVDTAPGPLAGAPATADGHSEPTRASSDDDSADGERTPAAGRPVLPAVEPRTIKRSWASTEVVFSSLGGGPEAVYLDSYGEPFEQDWLPTWILDGFSNGFSWEPFDAACPNGAAVNVIRGEGAALLPVGVDSRGVRSDIGHYRVVEEAERSVAFATRMGDIGVTKRYSLPEQGQSLGYSVEFKNLGSAPREIQPTLAVADAMPESESQYGPQVEGMADVDGGVEVEGPAKIEKKDRGFSGPISWVAVGDQYFFVGMEPEAPLSGQVLMHPVPGEGRYAVTIEAPPLSLAPGETQSFSFTLYMGPKVLDTFEDQGLKMASAVDFGFFGLVALPILAFLKILFGLIGNWGLSIIALTVVIKAALFPLSQKAFKSMKGMQKLQPEILAIKEKYPEDRERLNKETMELWKKHGVSPFGGCLPMIIQMPIWFALYRVLWNAVELYQTPFLYFCDLSSRDPYGVFPFFLGITMWLQQKFTPNTATDPMQKKMMQFMPIFFSLIMFAMPAGLVVYILVNTTLSIGQQWLIHRKHDDDSGPAPSKGAKAEGAKS